MEKLQRNEKILSIASGFLLFSIILMVILMMGILFNISPVVPAKAAIIATSVIIILHLIVFGGYIKFILKNRSNSDNRKGEYIGFSILMAFLGLLYMNGAFAALNDGNNIFGSVLMFISAFCDFIVSIITIILYFLKPQKVIDTTHE